MKKIILSALLVSMGAYGFAQKKNVNTASFALIQKDYEKAKTAIDAAILDESTKADPKTWFVRGDVYNELATQEQYNSLNPQMEAAKSYMKVLELDPKYNKEDMTNRLDFTARVYFNEGLHAFNAKKFPEAYEYLSMPITIVGLEDGKRFKNPIYDTIAATALLNRAYASYFSEDYEKALPDLNAAKDNPIASSATVYQMLADIYGRQGKEDEANKALEEGIAKYPKNGDLRNLQLNAVIKSGKLDDLVKKLEENAASEPENPETQYMLGITYYNLATPKDASGKELPRPANYDELVKKAEAAYTAAIALDKADKAEYKYNLGVIYFNQASDITKKMNALGTSAADNKKYDEMKVQRDAMFVKAMEPLEKAYNTLDAKFTSGKIEADEKVTFNNVMIALKEIYGRLGKSEKQKEVKQKMDSLM